ncbi:hypothetical protein JI664_21625 [Rhodobacter sp. NTK016B]|uniref:hypothetical protein n=1 Tax=Rhodobacter sp. NTK016B TaxID=2759676 RepID=UPI001A8D52F7|nr:hypothetical protein [Rhodobacter sp. NTK016B]MBN8294588.1 hypothetical protein [Rhodobacter sp. NTK016B]
MSKLPYSNSKAGQSREKEIRDTLRGVGASAVGFMVDDELGQVICQFRLHGRHITVPVSVHGYEAAWKSAFPCGPRTDKRDWNRKARGQAEIAVWGVLADWIKAQAAMIACGFFDADRAFLAHLHLEDGRSVGEALTAPDSPLRLPPPIGGTPEN